jgi:hypothetical protein
MVKCSASTGKAIVAALAASLICQAVWARESMRRPRTLTAAELERWYCGRIELGKDEDLARRVQLAEAFIDELFDRADSAAHRGLIDRIVGLRLPASVLRAVLRFGHVPGESPRAGRIVQVEAPLPGFAGKTARLSTLIPEGYSHDTAWPLIVSLHGTLGNDGYIRHWLSGSGRDRLKEFIIVAPAADAAHGWWPTAFGRAHVEAAIRWASRNCRIDADRIYLEGMSRGGIAAKTHGITYPDRYAAIVPRSGRPMRGSMRALLRNLHSLPMLALAGGKDHLLPVGVFSAERKLFEELGIPATMRLDAARGHEIFEDLNADVLEFMSKHRRISMPKDVSFASIEDGPGLRHYWVEIVTADRRANKTVSSHLVDRLKAKDEILKRLRAARSYHEHQRLLEEALRKGVIIEVRSEWQFPREIAAVVNRERNEIEITRAKLVTDVRFHLDDDLVDLNRPVKIIFNGRTLAQRTVERSARFMLTHAFSRGRRDITYWGAVTVKLANSAARRY